MASAASNSYGTILRRISAFGGVQMFNALVSLVRGKFVAMFLGTAGMGVNSLYCSATGMVQQVAGLGLNAAIVRQTAADADNPERLPALLAVVRRLVSLTSAFGALLCFFLAPLLSRWAFGDGSHTYGFMLLSLFVALSVGGGGYLSVLQGTGAVKRLTYASLVGGLTGLVAGVPLYYFFGTRGIVPALIATSAATFIFYYVNCRRAVRVASVRFVWKEHAAMAKRLLGLGAVLMSGTLIGSLVPFVINAYVRSIGSLSDVGLYQAATSITGQYIGLVISALTMEYFPRLSAVASDNGKMKFVINRQIEVVALIGAPLIVALILSAPLLIRLLLTEEFVGTLPLIRWMGLAMMVNLLQYPLGFVYFAKGNKRVFFWMETVFGNAVKLLFSILFYHLYGLIGLGISQAVCMTVYLVTDYAVNRRLYGFGYSGGVWREVSVSLLFTAGAFGGSFLAGWTGYAVMGALLGVSAFYSFVRLRVSMREERAEGGEVRDEE